jgi:hypothetical protein
MALKDMTSIFQPQKTPVGNGLAGDKGLAELTNAGSDLNIDGTLVPGTALVSSAKPLSPANPFPTGVFCG